MTSKQKRKKKRKKAKRKRPSVSAWAVPIGRPHYPTPEARPRIIESRDRLLDELIRMLVLGGGGDHARAVAQLGGRYGMDEVQTVLTHFQKTGERPFVKDGIYIYREYRLVFARCGAQRRFLNRKEFDALAMEYASLSGDRMFGSKGGDEEREHALRDLVLLYERMWPDLFPPDPPERPSDFVVPSVGTYPDALGELLEWGWQVDQAEIVARRKQISEWKPFVPDLERMVLDEGLLGGWPADPSAWAPQHALWALGVLRSYESAERLVDLMAYKEDWLSDMLPDVWAEMGVRAAEPLWAYLGQYDQPAQHRANAMMGLTKMAEKSPRYRVTVVQRLLDLLEKAPATDRTANAYIAYVLDKMEVEEAYALIEEVFDAGKMDESIFNPHERFDMF